MSSKSTSIVKTDSSGIQASEEAIALRLEGAQSSLLRLEGDGSSFTQNVLDGGAIANALTFAGDNSGNAFSFAKEALAGAGQLNAQALSATQQAAQSTTAELANAYRDARGATSGNALLVTVVVIILAVAGLALKGK